MLKKQKGLTAISWIILIGIIGVQGMLALRIIPIYLNDRSIKSVMTNLSNDPEMKGQSAQSLRALIDRRLNLNEIRDFENDKQAFKFKKTDKGLNIKLHYEKRGPIFGNLEFVASFDHDVTIPN